MKIFLGIDVKKIIEKLQDRSEQIQIEFNRGNLTEEQQVQLLIQQSANIEIPKSEFLLEFDEEDEKELKIEGTDEKGVDVQQIGGVNYKENQIEQYYKELVDGKGITYNTYKESVRKWLNEGSGKIVFIEGPGNKSISIDHFILFTYGMSKSLPQINSSNPYEYVDLNQQIIGWIPMYEKNKYLLRNKNDLYIFMVLDPTDLHKKWLEQRKEIWDRNIIWFLLKRKAISMPQDEKLSNVIDNNTRKQYYNYLISQLKQKRKKRNQILKEINIAKKNGNEERKKQKYEEIKNLITTMKNDEKKIKQVKEEIEKFTAPPVTQRGGGTGTIRSAPKAPLVGNAFASFKHFKENKGTFSSNIKHTYEVPSNVQVLYIPDTVKEMHMKGDSGDYMQVYPQE